MNTDVSFKILGKRDLSHILPMIQELSDFQISEELLQQRLADMISQNYQCAAILYGEQIVGICGMWFCTRHYIGKSMEIDHVFIKTAYRNQGLGKRFMNWIYNYAESLEVEAIELNTYLKNKPSHRFYKNEGFKALAYHFVKPLGGKWPGENQK